MFRAYRCFARTGKFREVGDLLISIRTWFAVVEVNFFLKRKKREIIIYNRDLFQFNWEINAFG